MINALNITSKRKSGVLLIIIFLLLLIGLYAYYQNYSQENKAFYKLKHEESQLNQLNAIYISLLKAATDARGYRLYQKPNLKTNYLNYRKETLRLLELYHLQVGKLDQTEQLYFLHLKNSIINRIKNLDTLINRPPAQYDPSSKRIIPVQMANTTEQIIQTVESSFKSILAYWVDKSNTSYIIHQQKNHSNDIIFTLSVALLLTVSFLWITSTYQFIQHQNILNQNLAKRNNEIEAIRIQLEDFAYIASHDLKTPLRSITGLLSIIQKKGENMEEIQKKEYFNVVINAAYNMNKLIDNLLEYARTGNIKEEMQQVEVEAIFNTQKHYFNMEINKLNGQIKTETAINTIMVYPILFDRLLMNLISNAIKYRRNIPPLIQIHCKDENDRYIFSVKDNGLGIPEHQYETIFKLFNRLHTNQDSNGIGLAVCKQIVALHGGNIWLTSKVGEGTTFYFTIPKTNIG